MPLATTLSHKHWCSNQYKYTQTMTQAGVQAVMAEHDGTTKLEGRVVPIVFVQTGFNSFQVWLADPVCIDKSDLHQGGKS